MSNKMALVYGIHNENIVLLPEDVAKAFAADHEAIWALRTYGDARRFQPQALNVAPGLDDDDYDDVPSDEDPYDAALTNEYLNGDWPPAASTIALDSLPDDLDDMIVEVEHMMSPPTSEPAFTTEADLLEMLKQRGYEVRRDDKLIEQI